MAFISLYNQPLPAVIGNNRYLQNLQHVSYALSLIKHEISSIQLADYIFETVAFTFHGAYPGQGWPIGTFS